MSPARLFALALALLIPGVAPSVAQEVTIRALGWYPNQPQTDEVERPLFRDIGQRTDGRFRAQYRTLSELNLRPFEHLRTLRSGAFDIMTIGASFVAGDDPVMIGHDIPGVALNFEEVRKVSDAWRPVLERRFAEQHGARLLTIAPFPPQIFFCRGEVRVIEDLRGKRVRVASSVAAELVQAMGGIAVTLAGPEVYAALQRGVVDCGVTGAAYANANSWHEVAKTIFPLPLGGYALFMHVVRQDFWNRLPEGHRQALTDQFSAAEKELWAIAQRSHEAGLRCNMGQTPCDGRLGAMTLAEISEADRNRFRQLVQQVALPGWFRDCERTMAGCQAEWTARVAPTIGIQP